MSGSIRGMPGLRAELAKLAQVGERLVNDVCAEFGRTVRAGAQGRAPVLSGDLQGAIDVRTDRGQLSVQIGVWSGPNQVEIYAPMVELGTSRTPAQPFLGPAAAQVSSGDVVRWAQQSMTRQGLG